jgi:hypothetical protein
LKGADSGGLSRGTDPEPLTLQRIRAEANANERRIRETLAAPTNGSLLWLAGCLEESVADVRSLLATIASQRAEIGEILQGVRDVIGVRHIGNTVEAMMGRELEALLAKHGGSDLKPHALSRSSHE